VNDAEKQRNFRLVTKKKLVSFFGGFTGRVISLG